MGVNIGRGEGGGAGMAHGAMNGRRGHDVLQVLA